jgi:hypothetical protein
MSFYLGKTVQKQYSNSTTLLALLQTMDQWVDINLFTSQFLTNVWNINTASGFALDIWGRILGVSRYIQVANTPGTYFGWNLIPTDVQNFKFATGNGSATTFTILGINNVVVTPNMSPTPLFYVNGVQTNPSSQSGSSVTFSSAPANGASITWTGGYNQAGPNNQPWSQAPFYSGSSSTLTYALDDQYYQKLLLVKAASNISRCDCPSINSVMRAMYGTRGACYVGYDVNHPMLIGYYFNFFPTPVEFSIIESGLFPQPAGTQVTYVFATLPYTPFGFKEMDEGTNPNYVNPWSVPGSPFYMPSNAQIPV